MTLLQLRYFQAVCQYGTVLQAAEALHISQPSVSNAVKELEKEFDVVLFHRQRRGMELTEAGRHFYNMTSHLLSHADQTTQTMRDISQKSKKLRLGIPPMIGSLFLPQIYHSFAGSYPDIQISIEEEGRGELMRQLAYGQLDAALLPHGKTFDKSFHTAHIADLETVCCVALTHPLASRRRIRISDLENQPLVLFKNSFFQTENIKEQFAYQAITPNIILYTNQLSTIRRMVARNIAAGFMFSKLADSFSDVISIPLDPPMDVKVSLVWRRNVYLSPEVQLFIEHIRDKYGEKN